MLRPRTPIGTFGEIYYEKAPGGRYSAFARFRDHDGQLRRAQTTAATQQAAARKLKELLAERAEHSVGQGELSGGSSFRHLVDIWLADLDLEGKLAQSTRDLYERNMEKLVMPAFANYTLREITVREVDQFIKTLASTKSYSTAKQARTVLSLAFGLAVRYDAIPRNPVRDTVRLQRPPSQAQALTVGQVDVIRQAARGWRRGSVDETHSPTGSTCCCATVSTGAAAARPAASASRSSPGGLPSPTFVVSSLSRTVTAAPRTRSAVDCTTSTGVLSGTLDAHEATYGIV